MLIANIVSVFTTLMWYEKRNVNWKEIWKEQWQMKFEFF